MLVFLRNERRDSMRRIILGAVATGIVAGAIAGPARAEKTVPIISEGDLKKSCNANKGGVFSPSNSSGVYVCLTGTGGVIVCGGGTEEQKKTCSVGRMAPSDRSLVKNRLAMRRR
jgi:hypothetical protein